MRLICKYYTRSAVTTLWLATVTEHLLDTERQVPSPSLIDVAQKTEICTKMEHKIDRIAVLLLHKRDRNCIPQERTNTEFSFVVAMKRRIFFRCIVKKIEISFHWNTQEKIKFQGKSIDLCWLMESGETGKIRKFKTYIKKWS